MNYLTPASQIIIRDLSNIENFDEDGSGTQTFSYEDVIDDQWNSPKINLLAFPNCSLSLYIPHSVT